MTEVEPPILQSMGGLCYHYVMKMKTAVCKSCGELKQREELRLDSKGHIKERLCTPCRVQQLIVLSGAEYRVHKKDACEVCGFTGHPCQLDVDHIDNNHKNNELTNLQTLCANCHRLKSYKHKGKTTWEK